MKQRIMHGAELDVATPSEVGEIVARAFELQAIDEYDRVKGVIALDGTGAGSVALESVSAQYDWLIERVTLTGANALVQLFENQPAGTDLLEVVQIGVGGLYSDAFGNKIHVTANSQVVITVAGGPAGGQVTYNLQIKLKRHRGRRR